jgi:beta-lactam-binding protein with PASTA domain
VRFSFDFSRIASRFKTSGHKNIREWFEAGDDPEKRYFRILLACSVGLVLLMVLIGLITFILSLKVSEQTMVPDVTGLELSNAIVELQDKALYPVLQMVQSSETGDKGTVLAQDPGASTLLKVGSRVVIKVSRGAVIEKLDNYVGWNIDDLETHLSTLVSVYGPLLRISKPVIRVFDDDTTPGTILQQKPAPGTELTSLTDLVLVVSKGPEGATFAVKDYAGMRYTKAVAELASSETPFLISSRAPKKGEKAGVIVSQTPSVESLVPIGTLVQLTMTDPDDVPSDSIFGILQKTLPTYPVPVDLLVESIAPSGEKRVLLTTKHSGGVLTIPFVEEKDTVIVVSVNGAEVAREQVKKK